MMKKCKICDEEFDAHGKACYCSVECRIIGSKKVKSAAQGRWNNKNPDYWNNWRDNKLNDEPRYFADRMHISRGVNTTMIKYCRHCNNIFTSNKSTKIYCSDACQIEDKELDNWYRSKWGNIVREDNSNYASHHIYPVTQYPFFALEVWNGVPMSPELHREFHKITCGASKMRMAWDIDWIGVLVDFLDDKINR